MWFLLFHQERSKRRPWGSYHSRVWKLGCVKARNSTQETEHLSLGEVASSEEDESEYEDCQEEEEDWQTCLGSSGPDEEACGQDCKEGHAVGLRLKEGAPQRGKYTILVLSIKAGIAQGL